MTVKHVIAKFSLAAFAVCIGVFGACAHRVSALSSDLPPKTPSIVAFAGGSIPPHADYVRLTYVYADGSETGPSAELPNGVGASTLTRVYSPEARPGVIGYNVYAVINNGDSGTGHVLQNDTPIPIGTDYDEPPAGWRTQGKVLVVRGADRTIEAIAPGGSSVTMPRTPSVGGSIVFSGYAGTPPVVTIRTTPAAKGVPGKADFSFDRSTRFSELPTFLLYASPFIGGEDPSLVKLTDRTTGTLVATYDKYEIGPATFLGQMREGGTQTTPFRVRAGDVYEATFVGFPASMLKVDTQKVQNFTLPPVRHASVALHVPPPSAGLSRLLVRTSQSPPLGVAAPNDASIGHVAMYAIVILQAHATYDGVVHATVHFPRGTAPGTGYSVAAYDPGWWTHGWYLHVLHGQVAKNGTLDLSFDFNDRRITARTYVLALYADRKLARARRVVRRAVDTRPLMAVLGDSTTILKLVPPIARHCAIEFEAAPNCQYQYQPGADYASIAGTRAGYRVLNLSFIGAETTVEWTVGAAVTQNQVPQIPAGTAVVVVAAGSLDNSETVQDQSARLDELTTRIRSVAPHARIVYVGVRYFNDSLTNPPRKLQIDRWDEREATLGNVYGAFLDERPLLENGWTDDNPDGIHLSALGVQRVADALVPILRRLRQRAAASTIPPAALPPKTPSIVAFSGGTLAPHVDYVRLTYVRADGSESAPSSEVPNGVGAQTLTRVFSPEARAGATGYNVYAVTNNGDNDTGHVLQNDMPLPLGTTFDEPASGWRTNGKPLALADSERTVEAIPPTGSSVTVPRTPTLGGSVVFSRSAGTESPIVTLATTGALPDVPGKIVFSFDRSVHFDELPTFLLYPSALIGIVDPAIVTLTDVTTGAHVATYDKYEFGAVTFLGEMWNGGTHVTPFDVRGGDVYEASFVGFPPSMRKLQLVGSGDLALPKVGQTSVSVHVPTPSDGSAALIVRTSATPPLGVLPPDDGSIEAVAMYAIAILQFHTTYDGLLTATVHLPAGTPPGTEFSIAAYDPGWWKHGWYEHVATARSTRAGTVSFSFDLQDRRVYARTYVLALCAIRNRPRPVARVRQPVDARRVMAVIGDSTSLVELVPPITQHCAVRIEAAPNCQFLYEPGDNFATRAGMRAGYDVVNLSYVGTQTTVEWLLGAPASQFQVPQIPPNASVVVVAAGLLDNSENGDDVSARLDQLTAGIRRVAPHARIVYVGVRYFNDSTANPQRQAQIDHWDDRAAALGKQYGAFLDLRPILPEGWTAENPDGVHLAQTAEERVAQALLKTLQSLP